MPTRSVRRERGFTLIEVMLALVILGIGVTMAMVCIADSSASISDAREVTAATELADRLLSTWMDADSYTGVRTKTGSEGIYDWTFDFERIESGDLALRESEKSGASLGLFRMGVTVTWPRDAESPKRVRLTTLRSVGSNHFTE